MWRGYLDEKCKISRLFPLFSISERPELNFTFGNNVDTSQLCSHGLEIMRYTSDFSKIDLVQN